MFPGLGWGTTSASPESRFIQHKGYAGSGLVFHLLDLGCSAFQLSSLSQAGQPALCRAVNTPLSRQALFPSLGNLYVAAGGGIGLRALTTLGAFGESSHSLASSHPGSPFYLWVFLTSLLCFYFLGTTTCVSGLWYPLDHTKM